MNNKLNNGIIYIFNSKQDEAFDKYHADLRELVKSCEIGTLRISY